MRTREGVSVSLVPSGSLAYVLSVQELMREILSPLVEHAYMGVCVHIQRM